MSDVTRGPDGKWLPGTTPPGAGRRFKPGETGNPGGQPKTRKELRMLAREGLPKAFERAMKILNDDGAEWRAWIEAGKFLGAYAHIAPPKNAKEDDAEAAAQTSALSVEERRAIARARLSTETQPSAPGTETEH